MLSVGKVYNHPKGGPVYITSGKFLSNDRLSNFWYWKPIHKDGTLGEEKSGYGGNWDELSANVEIDITVKLK